MGHFEEPKENNYQGPERRKEQRRKSDDRREMIRFEPDKEDRRSDSDRRKDHRDVWKQRKF